MPEQIYYCPMCKGNVLSTVAETPTTGESSKPVSGEKLYCPSCEMLVESIFGSLPRRPTQDPGRTRSGGANVGGSQRGDQSDEGASQWRRTRRTGNVTLGITKTDAGDRPQQFLEDI